MLIFLVVGLTLIASWSIIRITTKKKYKKFDKVLYRQSDMHNLMKKFFSKELPVSKQVSSQLKKRKDKDMVKVLIISNQAYWVSDNIFYVADAENDNVVPDTARPVDINSMSKKDIDRMLFILDNLEQRDINDSGSSGDKRF
jgi:hypothetical protein